MLCRRATRRHDAGTGGLAESEDFADPRSPVVGVGDVCPPLAAVRQLPVFVLDQTAGLDPWAAVLVVYDQDVVGLCPTSSGPDDLLRRRVWGCRGHTLVCPRPS